MMKDYNKGDENGLQILTDQDEDFIEQMFERIIDEYANHKFHEDEIDILNVVKNQNFNHGKSKK